MLTVKLPLFSNWLIKAEPNCRVPGVLTTPEAQAENSEVLPAESVAVAVKKLPVTEAVGKLKTKLAWPAASVVTLVKPRYFSPSPNPDGSQVVFEKNSILNCVLNALSSMPWIVVVPPADTADVIT